MVKKDTSGAPLGPPPSRRMLASLVKLDTDLKQAFATPTNDHSQAELERVQCVHALKAMSNFLRTNNAPLDYSQRLYHLALALNDLNEGKVDPLLEPTTTGGVNPGKVTTEWLNRAKIALGIAVLTASGSTRNQAAKEAERITGNDASKLLSWYDEFRKPPDTTRIKNLLARKLFDDGLEMIEVITQDMPATRALAGHFFARAAANRQNQS